MIERYDECLRSICFVNNTLISKVPNSSLRIVPIYTINSVAEIESKLDELLRDGLLKSKVANAE